MKQAGPERDKVIAELRGDCYHDYELTRESDFPDEDAHIWTCKLCLHDEYTWGRRPEHPGNGKPYSTDIATAMTLWEEMKGEALMLALDYAKSSKIKCIFFEDSSVDVYYHENCETEADAISGAWLKWKQGG